MQPNSSISDVEIESIHPPYLFSVRHDDRTLNEFDRLFEEWNDLGSVIGFLEENSHLLGKGTWQHLPTPELAAAQVLDEAEEMEDTIGGLCDNAANGHKPDLDSLFHDFGGAYKYVKEYVPVKSYGGASPSLLRLYAIKLESNTYVVTGGGIKLCRTIQDSPGMDKVMPGIDQVRTWLKANGIMDKEDI